MKIKDDISLHLYFESLLDFTDETHTMFYNSLKHKMFPSHHIASNISKNNNTNINTRNTKPAPKKYEKKQKSGTSTVEEDDSNRTGAKKKTKFHSFYDQNGGTNDVVTLKGRHRCDCQAVKHNLVNNCMQCGRIVCEQEGSGACVFCGNLVCTEEEQRLIDSQTKKGDNFKKTLQDSKKGWEEAMAQRDRLLEYDRNCTKRTAVIDDESDYFKSNSVWLSEEEKSKLSKLETELRDNKHASRLQKKVTLDFAGRQIVEEDLLSKEKENEILRQIMDATSGSGFYSNTIHPDSANHAPIFDEKVISAFPKLKNANTNNFDGVFNKVQDSEFLIMSDMKNCMSMHQPWASMLVSGIKRHEGRSWYSAHRGRLWIASTAKPVEMDEVKKMEQFYKALYNDEDIKFPTQYPSGVLLGCVKLNDCLPQEEYRKVYKNGESESPFVFICGDPQELSVKFPVKGEHKICKRNNIFHLCLVIKKFFLSR